MTTRMKVARKRVQGLAGERKIRRRKAKKRALRVGTVHSEMPLWGRPGYLLRRLHQIHYALFFEECAGYDITPVQYGLLTTLSLNPNLDQNSLARELGIDRTNVADVLNRLARRGLVERRRSPNDARATEELITLPLMTDPTCLVTLDALNRFSSAAQFTDLNLYTLAVCQTLTLTLDRGNSDASAVAYARLGMVAGLWYGEYAAACRAGHC